MKYQFEKELLDKFYEGFNIGYSKGHEWGEQEGEIDKANNYTYWPHWNYHISTKEYYAVKNIEVDEMKSQLDPDDDNEDFSNEELINLFRTGYDQGFSNGFTDGYKAKYSFYGGGSWSRSGFYGWNFEIYETPEYWLPKYKPIGIEELDIEDEKTELHIKVKGLLDVINLNCLISNHFTEIQNGFLSPSSMKINININDYPFDYEDTRLALLFDFEAKSFVSENLSVDKSDESYDEQLGLAFDEEEIRISSDTYLGFLSWVDYAFCDGVAKDVHIQVIPYFSTTSDYSTTASSHAFLSDKFHVILTYQKSQSISHDPKMGVSKINSIDLYKLDIQEENIFTIDWNIMSFVLATVGAVSFIFITRKMRYGGY
jgi:hypothetical protein